MVLSLQILQILPYDITTIYVNKSLIIYNKNLVFITDVRLGDEGQLVSTTLGLRGQGAFDENVEVHHLVEIESPCLYVTVIADSFPIFPGI